MRIRNSGKGFLEFKKKVLRKFRNQMVAMSDFPRWVWNLNLSLRIRFLSYLHKSHACQVIDVLSKPFEVGILILKKGLPFQQ